MLDAQQMDQLASVRCDLAFIDLEENLVLHLGSDANVIADWDSGVFKDNFQGIWGMLDGHVVYLDIIAEEDGYNIYSVPIKLNGVECGLHVVYDFNAEAYKVLGARKGTSEGAMSDRNLIKIKSGDKITTIAFVTELEGDRGTEAYELDTFVVDGELTFEDQPLGNGEYGYFFEFVTPNNEFAYSEVINFTVADGRIITSRFED